MTVDETDAENGRIKPRLPGIRFFLDYDRAVSRAFGATAEGEGPYRAIGCCSTGICASPAPFR